MCPQCASKQWSASPWRSSSSERPEAMKHKLPPLAGRSVTRQARTSAIARRLSRPPVNLARCVPKTKLKAFLSDGFCFCDAFALISGSMSASEAKPAARAAALPEEEESDEDELPLGAGVAAAAALGLGLALLRKILPFGKRRKEARKPPPPPDPGLRPEIAPPPHPAVVAAWSVRAVGDFLRFSELGALAPAFAEAGVDGAMLLQLTAADMASLGATHRVQRVRRCEWAIRERRRGALSADAAPVRRRSSGSASACRPRARRRSRRWRWRCAGG